MEVNELRSYISLDPLLAQRFLGVIPLQKLARNRVLSSVPSFIIVYIPPDHGDIGHYTVCAVVPSHHAMLYYFDPASVSAPRDVLEFANKNNYTLKNMSRNVQGLNSCACGLYVLFFVHVLFRHGPAVIERNVATLMGVPPASRDAFVIREVSQIFRKHPRFDLATCK